MCYKNKDKDRMFHGWEREYLRDHFWDILERETKRYYELFGSAWVVLQHHEPDEITVKQYDGYKLVHQSRGMRGE